MVVFIGWLHESAFYTTVTLDINEHVLKQISRFESEVTYRLSRDAILRLK